MKTLSLKKPLGFETKLTLDAVARGTVVERSGSKRVVVVDRAPARPAREGGRSRAADEAMPEFDTAERHAPRVEVYRPEPRPMSDFAPRLPQFGRSEMGRGDFNRAPANRSARGEDDGRSVPHLLWPPRVAPSEFDPTGVALPANAAEPLTVPRAFAGLLSALRERFPAAFPAAPVPLRLGVEAELASALAGTPEAERLDDFLFHYRAHPAYMATLVTAERRVGLDGEPAERIEPEEREQALWTLRALEKPAA